jgi:hypothetical protein
MSKCYPIDRHLQMRRNAKSSCGLRPNSSQDSIEDAICVFFMRPTGVFVRPSQAPCPHAASDDKSAFTMNSMARETFRIYMR